MTRAECIARSWRDRLAAAGITNLAALLADDDLASLPGDRQALTKPGLGGRLRMRWTLPGPDAGNVIYVKRYTRTPLARQLDRIRRQTVAHSQAWWEHRQSERLAAAHIGVAAAVGFAEEMRGAFERRSLLLIEGAPGEAFDRLWQVLCRQNAACTRGAARHEITRRLARFVRAFHDTGYCHRDLYLCHVFAEIDATGRRAPVFRLIDLARTHRPRWRRRWIIKDLSQLDASARQIGAARSDRLRFLRHYLGAGEFDQKHTLTRRVVRKSESILRRIARKQTP